jgi:quercetin dioxygenase-like cupin family protein
VPFTPLVEKENIVAQLMLGDNVQISFLQNPPGANFPVHSHDAEQILIMLEGTEEHIIDGEEVHMEAGDICFHPGGVPHGGTTKTGFKGIDIFCPPRTEPGGHVERMKKYGTMPNENGEYSKNNITANVKPWYQGVLESLKK